MENTTKTITKNSTFEAAYESVQGTKFKLVTKYKKFTGSVLTIEDLIGTANMAIWQAWKNWDEDKTKFNTHAYNMINWSLMDLLNEMNSKFKANAQTSYELSRDEETFETVAKIGKTHDEEFNKANDLDGSALAKRKVNRDLWNAYVSYKTLKDRPIAMINESQFKTDEGEFNIFDTIGTENRDLKDALMLLDLEKLPKDKQKIANMLLDGADVAEVAKEMKMSKIALLKMYAPTDNKPVRGIRNRRIINKIRKGEMA